MTSLSSFLLYTKPFLSLESLPVVVTFKGQTYTQKYTKSDHTLGKIKKAPLGIKRLH